MCSDADDLHYSYFFSRDFAAIIGYVVAFQDSWEFHLSADVDGNMYVYTADHTCMAIGIPTR